MIHLRISARRAARGKKVDPPILHSVFLGNPGTGKTTVARLLGWALRDAGALETGSFVEVSRQDLVGDTLGSSALKTQALLESALGGVLFIDKAYSLYQDGNNQFGQESVDTIMKFMEDHRDAITVIFAGYTDRMVDFLQMNPGLQSRIPNRFDFADYSQEEIGEIGYRNLCDADFKVDEDAYRRLVAEEYRSNGDNSNARWIRNVNQRLINEAHRRMDAEGSDDLETITIEDLRNTFGNQSEDQAESVDSILAELDSMVGLAPVKSWVRQLVREVQFNAKLRDAGGPTTTPTYHMSLTGTPGTGKTTVALLIARLFHNLGILQKPVVKEAERSTLVGRHIGKTEAQTSRAIDEALGGVLFIDEAYQLAKADSPRDFGADAIETLLTRLERDRSKFVGIFAGYTDEMERFFALNPGLRSRIPHSIEFPDYAPEEVGQIVTRRLEQHWTFDADLALQTVVELYSSLDVQDKSNGRWARNFTDEVERRHKNWVIENDSSVNDMRHISDEVFRSFTDSDA